jgi:hypothetical protein
MAWICFFLQWICLLCVSYNFSLLGVVKPEGSVYPHQCYRHSKCIGFIKDTLLSHDLLKYLKEEFQKIAI